jgi:chorismate mutase
VTDPGSDPVIQALRGQLTETDRELLAAFARRVELAGQIKQRKGERGYPLIDPERERLLLELWRASADGTLSDAVVTDLFDAVLALSKRELES